MSNEKDIENCMQRHEEILELSISEVRSRAQNLRNDGSGECEWCGDKFPRLVNNA